MMDDPLSHQIALAVLISYVLEWLKNSHWFPFLSAHSDVLNRWSSIVAAFVSSVGIQFVMQGTFDTGWHIALSIPPGSVVIDTVMHTLGQFGIQEGVYKGFIQKPKPTLSLNTSTGEASINVQAPRP